jgi:hypothetical protein
VAEHRARVIRVTAGGGATFVGGTMADLAGVLGRLPVFTHHALVADLLLVLVIPRTGDVGVVSELAAGNLRLSLAN